MERSTRIPAAEIETIKRDVSVEDFSHRELGVIFTGQGANRLGRCPLPGHNDETPSFVVTPSSNLWHCFGCNAGGSIIDLVQITKGTGFRRTIEILRTYLPSLSSTANVADAPAHDKRRTLMMSADAQSLLNEVVAYYHSHIEEARPYLASRGLDDEAMINHFQLGLSNRTLGYHMPAKQYKAGKEIRNRLIEIGILRESGHESFCGSLVFPVFDEAGNVVEIYGRKITTKLREGTPLHLYLKGQHRGVWNWQGLVNGETVILCEALIDALTFYQAGFHNVTASYGVHGFTEDHWSAFKRYGTKRVLIAYDPDEAGELAARALARGLMELGIDCYRVEFPLGLDANAYAQKIARDDETGLNKTECVRAALIQLLECARPMRVGQPTFPAPAIINTEQSTPVILPAESAAVVTPAPTPAASVLMKELDYELKGDDLNITIGDRHYRVRGVQKNLTTGVMKVNVRIVCGASLHVDTLDLCSAKQRNSFADEAAIELALKKEIIARDLKRVLLIAEEVQDAEITKALTPQEQPILLTDEEREAALALLQSPNLIGRIIEDFKACGVVGEETNLLICYLGAVSRKLPKPLGILIQSSSAAGKTSLMDAVLHMMPKEQVVKYSAMTGQSLFYMGDVDLRHKILAIVEEEGARRASYPLKLLQSEGEITIASTGKDPNNGRHVAYEYEVHGPVMLLLATTAVEIDPELMNRCLVPTMDEDREQTRAIHQQQRQQYTLDGLWARQDRARIRRLHQNAQRLLQVSNVVNPYANELTFLDNKTRTRRDHEKYLTLICAIALLHQYQRPTRVSNRGNESRQYIEVTLDDIECANKLANEILGRSLDELPAQTRKLLMQIDEMVTQICELKQIKREELRFTRREIREWTNWHDTQLRMHLDRLVELEYVIVHRGGRGQQFVYELVYDGQGKDGEQFLIGLIDVEQLRMRESMMQTSRG